jgi:hypothetical protein
MVAEAEAEAVTLPEEKAFMGVAGVGLLAQALEEHQFLEVLVVVVVVVQGLLRQEVEVVLLPVGQRLVLVLVVNFKFGELRNESSNY